MVKSSIYTQLKAWEMRRLILEMDYRSGSGHIGGAMSACEILATLFFGVMDHSPERFRGRDPQRDRFVLSKGHISDALYSVLALSGYIEVEELNTYCAFGSRLGGHPTNQVPGIEMNTGALGHGLSAAVGMAVSAKIDKTKSKVYALLGDGELAEGSIWEAAMSAAHYKLDNLTAIIDRNRLQIGGDTEDVMALEPLADKWRSFGWDVVEADGHDVAGLTHAINLPREEKPRVIIARTIKGRGVSFMENTAKWHHGTPNNEEYKLAAGEINAKITELSKRLGTESEFALPVRLKESTAKSGASYVSAREEIMNMLTERAHTDGRIVALTSDARGSAAMGGFIKAHPDKFIEMGIAEQNELGVAAGLAVSGKVPFVAAPACFMSARSYEQVKADLAYTGANVKIIAVSGGVSYGELGQTHHSLQDIAALRGLPGLQVIVPADAVSARALAEKSLDEGEPMYMRVGRAATRPVYSAEEAEKLKIGKASILRNGKDGCVITTGIMALHVLEAADNLAKKGIELTVADMHTIKPFDTAAVCDLADKFGRLMTVEEHVKAGGLGSLVCESVAENPVPVKIAAFPDENLVCGKDKELYKEYGLDAASLAGEIEKWLEK